MAPAKVNEDVGIEETHRLILKLLVYAFLPSFACLIFQFLNVFSGIGHISAVFPRADKAIIHERLV